ncbi:hypothetical protein [Lysobacter capsici]|uniref:hypothetical protein n=1 Tax=Lysobacter capsici TaxID=435897 RepID=UPI0011DF0999|nr:hypothetical protein [Lysobacter capsici]
MSVFIIGLPSGVRKRLIAEAQRNNVHLGFALAAPDKTGTLNFVPFEAQACADLNTHCDTVAWSQLQIIVLPYVSVGPDLSDTVEIVKAEGATVYSPTPGTGRWPALSPDGRYTSDFNNDTYAALLEHLNWQGLAMPSERFERSANRHTNYLIMPGALAQCNAVDPSRFRFLYKSGDALEEFCRKRGAIGKTLFHFFEEKGLDLATTGGITTVLRLMRQGRQLGAAQRSQIHLKEGDATTPQAAARIYFQHLDENGQFRLALFYVGPHPDCDIDRSIDLEAD